MNMNMNMTLTCGVEWVPLGVDDMGMGREMAGRGQGEAEGTQSAERRAYCSGLVLGRDESRGDGMA